MRLIYKILYRNNKEKSTATIKTGSRRKGLKRRKMDLKDIYENASMFGIQLVMVDKEKMTSKNCI